VFDSNNWAFRSAEPIASHSGRDTRHEWVPECRVGQVGV
jgi:hypothetical protein